MPAQKITDLLTRKGKFFLLIAIPLLSLVMHWRVFDLELMSQHVWRQTQTQSNVLNFAEGDMNILNPKRNRHEGGNGIYRREFPLMQWVFAWFYRALGDHIFISRFLSWLIGLSAVGGMYFLGKWAFRNELAGLIAAWTFNFSPEFFYYTVNPLADNLALAAAIWGMAFFFRAREQETLRAWLVSGIFLSLATLVKLPFVMFFGLPGVKLLLNLWRKNKPIFQLKSGAVMALMLVPPLAWYAWVIPQWPKEGLVEGVFSEKSGLGNILGIVFSHFSSTLPELLLNYATVPLFLGGWVLFFREKKWNSAKFLPVAAAGLGIIAYFLYEIEMISTVHDYYLFPFMPLLFLLVAFGGMKMLTSDRKLWKYLAITALVVAPLTCGLRMAARWNPENPGYNADLLRYEKELRAAVPDDALVIAGNDKSQFIVLYMIHKKGWNFDLEYLSEGKLKRAIAGGAEYMYSDSRKIESDERINRHFEKMVFEGGSVRVFKLKKGDDPI